MNETRDTVVSWFLLKGWRMIYWIGLTRCERAAGETRPGRTLETSKATHKYIYSTAIHLSIPVLVLASVVLSGSTSILYDS